MAGPRYSRFGQVCYFLRLAASLMRGKPLPAIGGMSVTDACNLECAHCWRKNQGLGHIPFPQILASLDTLYAMGARYLYIQGGEPFAWRDGEHRLTDVVEAAKRAGFFHVAVCTNGTFPLDAQPDSYSVSLEGSHSAHDRIRNGSFDRVVANLQDCSHPNAFLNVTFNRVNRGELAWLADWVTSFGKLRGLLVNFHIPYPGVEHLTLDQSERAAIAQEALELKARGYPILNTRAGLRALALNNWKRPLDLSVVTDCRSFYSCCRARGNDRICRECGYAGWAELSRVLEWDWASAWEVLGKLHRR